MIELAMIVQMTLGNPGFTLPQTGCNRDSISELNRVDKRCRAGAGSSTLLAEQQSDPGKDITDDPHGKDPHGRNPHDEIHDSGLPANDKSNDPYAERDVYGNKK